MRTPILTLASFLLLAPLALPATSNVEIVLLDGFGPAAAVVLKGDGVERKGTANHQGRVLFFHLRAGRYLLIPVPQGALGATELDVGPGQDLRVRLSVRDGALDAKVRPATDGTLFSGDDLRSTPRPSDPWSVVRDVPGVILDRVNVGGSETAQQSVLVSHGDDGSGATWTLDGIDITDPAALGSLSFYPDMDAMSGVRVQTTSVDVRVRTPGAQVGLYLKEPPDAFHFALHFRGAGDPLQADNATPELKAHPLLRNHTDRVLELGGEAGGVLKADRLWLWGAFSQNALKQDTFTEHQDNLRTTNFTTKGRLRLGQGLTSLLALRSEKVDEDRDTTLSASPEARWRQSGPVHLLALEDRRDLGGSSLLSRLSCLDAGFQLEPQGGGDANAFEDFRGIARGSYYSFKTTRRRLESLVEMDLSRQWLGLDHSLLLGAGYRFMPVSTLLAWPGNKVLAFERQSVFFRAFGLTGFALPTRDQNARSVQDDLEAYLQDTVRAGRFVFTLGVRFDRQTGRNLASSVDANPVFPELLGSVAYPGAPSRFRWLDALPRAGVQWNVRRDGSLVAGVAYAAYASILGSGDVTFDNPIGRNFASLTYYWNDRNADHIVETGELDPVRGRVGSSGLNPLDPNSTASPNIIDPNLKSPRTHEASASLEKSFGPRLGLGLRFSARRTLNPLWQPLRGLSLGDYALTGAVQGNLLGRDYSVGFFAPASLSKIVPGDGRILTNRAGYHQDAVTVEAMAEGTIKGLRWSLSGTWTDWREYFDDISLSVQDPTPLDRSPIQDGGILVVGSSGLGRGDLFVNARWNAHASLRSPMFFGLLATAHLSARDGFPIPYFQDGSTGDPTSGTKSVLIAQHLDSYRLPAVVLLDARLQRSFHTHGGDLTAAMDVFNVLNAATTLQLARDIELPTFNLPREVVRPRIVRLGLEYRF